jgi:hypothetical protein
MEKQQALTILKQVIDQAIQSGVFKNAESVATAANALQTVAQELELNKSKSK